VNNDKTILYRRPAFGFAHSLFFFHLFAWGNVA
jgi:hypothetical protein